MGLFCVNMHFRTTDDQALPEVLAWRGISNYRVLLAKNGWVSLYEQGASEQNEEWIRELTASLSRALSIAAIAFLVHDSDIACYWLYDGGELLDEYNSCPHYFDDFSDASGGLGPSGSKPDVLVRYCQSGTTTAQLETILNSEVVFAEEIVEQLATLLGISSTRALANYEDVAEGADELLDPGDEDAGRISPSSQNAGVNDVLAVLFGNDGTVANPDPQRTALVNAASRDDVDEIDRLLAAGIDINAAALTPLPNTQPMAPMIPGGLPQIAMTPLIAAVVYKRQHAIKHLLQCGADPDAVHPMFGAPIHTAVRAADVEVLKLLIESGADVNVTTKQGQTARQILESALAIQQNFIKAQAMFQKFTKKVPPAAAAQFSQLSFPTEAWAECDRLLKEHGAR